MLSPFSRAIAYYLGGGFALALLCTLWLYDSSGAPTSGDRRGRRILAFAILGVLHPVIAVTAYVLARGTPLDELDDEPRRRAPLPVLTSLVVSTAAMFGVLLATADL